MNQAEVTKKLIQISRDLAQQCSRLRFSPPVYKVYNPLVYARQAWEDYLEKYAHRGVQVVLLGMNPGPYGMAQTGVPFGEINAVRDWLHIEGKIIPPKKQHPKRPIQGFACTRSEVSGKRVWTWAKRTFGTPDDFFKRFFILNYCPLVFMEESGKNRTPDKLPAEKKKRLFALCDKSLRSSIELIEPQFVIGVGAFSESRAKAALCGMDTKIGRILHPSPANPSANKGWAQKAVDDLKKAGISL